VARFEGTTDTEVGELHGSIRHQQDILRLQIATSESSSVCKSQSGGNLS
jgi:hypothetical protein